METYQAVLVIICVGVVLVLLFYLITRYFNYRLRKSLHDPSNIYSMVDGLEVRKDSDLQEAVSEEFAENVYQSLQDERQNMKKSFGKMTNDLVGSDIKESLASSRINVYGIPTIPVRRRMQRRASIPIVPQSQRENGSNRSFNVQKLETFRTGNTSISNPTLNDEQNQGNTTHKFMSQLVSYTEEGISAVEFEMSEIWIQSEGIKVKEKGKLKKKYVSVNDDHFYDSLEAYGFDHEVKSAFKFQKIVKLSKMRAGRIYRLSELKVQQQKEEINLIEFHKYKNILEIQYECANLKQ